MDAHSLGWNINSKPPQSLLHTEVLAAVARTSVPVENKFVTLGDVVNRAGLTTVAEFLMLTLEELYAFAAEAGFVLPADATRIRVKLSSAFHTVWLPAQKLAAYTGKEGAESTREVQKKRGGVRNTMESVVPPVAPLPGFDPRQVRITRTFYSLFPAAGTVEHLSIAQVWLQLV